MTPVEAGNMTICGTEIEARQVAEALARIAAGKIRAVAFGEGGPTDVRAPSARGVHYMPCDLRGDEQVSFVLGRIAEAEPSGLDGAELEGLTTQLRDFQPVAWAL